MTTKIGKDAKFYVDAAGNSIGGTPVWTELDIVEEATSNNDRDQAEVKNRSSDETKVLLGHKNRTVEVTVTHTPGNAGYEALRDAYEDGDDIAVAVYDGAIATVGSEGLQMDAKVVAMNRNEPLSENITYAFTLRPSAESAEEPSWAETTA